MINNELLRLMRSFPNSFMNQNGEFIAHKEANEYFIINNIQIHPVAFDISPCVFCNPYTVSFDIHYATKRDNIRINCLS